MKSLIVEDDPVSVRVLGQFMSKYGTLDHVENGRQALELFLLAHESGSPYDLILMDVMMPEVDGLKSTLEIRQAEARMKLSAEQRVKVVMITALSDPRTVMKALYESNADSYLFKPIALEKLVDELRVLRLVP